MPASRSSYLRNGERNPDGRELLATLRCALRTQPPTDLSHAINVPGEYEIAQHAQVSLREAGTGSFMASNNHAA